ncbi:MAG: PAS domain S-box protein, partial [Ignavibacteria bacterium]|nr:PAS domain S-box protein [Ignavibacteria bacterium]
YEFPIWIKDASNKIICLNAAYANLLGVEESLAVGKKLEAFLPPHQKAIYKLLDEYIFTNRQQILLEGYSKKVDNFEVFQNIIHVPLLDNFNNIYAVVGLIVDNKYDYYNFWGTEEFNNEFIESFPNPLALLSSRGIFEKVNERFGVFLQKKSGEIIDKRIEDIFPFFITKNFSLFIQSDIKKDCIKLSNDYTPTDSVDYFAKVFLIKIFDNEKRVSNVLITLEKSNDEKKPEDELQYILTHRGKMFDILIQKNPEPIFIYDKENLKFLEVNNAAVKLYGYSRDEFLQMDLTDLYAPEDIQTLLDSFGDEASESRFSKPFRHRKKDGTNVLVEISKTSFNFNDRESHFNIVKDITTTFETEKQNQMLKAIFAETDLMVFTTDPSGFITFVNHVVSEKLGFTSAEMLQSSFASLVVDDDRAIINTSIFQSHLKDSVVLRTILKTSDEQFIDTEVTATPILDFDGAVDSFTIIAKTQPVSILPDEPRVVVKEVIKEVIKEVVVEKPDTVERKTAIPDSNFLSGMFHEILTPINVIIGFSQELISSTEKPTEEQLEASDIINQNRIKMMDTMNSVVEYSDIIQNKFPLKLEDISITEVIEKLDNNIKDISGINDIQFAYGKISSSLKFRTDKQKFESFILSLIKVVSRLSKDKKIYFSAFSIDDNSFVLGISDQYGNPSEYVANILEQVFINERDPKDFGLPKLTTYLSKTLLSFLGGKFYKSSSETLRHETGFLFPIKSSATFVNQKYEPFQGSFTSVNQSNTAKIIEEPYEAPAEKYEPPQENIIHSTYENSTQINPLENDRDIFKSAQPVETEFILETEEAAQTEEEYFAMFANEAISEETK